MAKRTYDDKMKLDMSFGKALERYAGTSPAEMHANIAKANGLCVAAGYVMADW